jgi:hypothetical protein
MFPRRSGRQTFAGWLEQRVVRVQHTLEEIALVVIQLIDESSERGRTKFPQRVVIAVFEGLVERRHSLGAVGRHGAPRGDGCKMETTRGMKVI